MALPAEHGSWGLVLEPIVLGLLLAPGAGGALLALAAFLAFLWQRPARLWWSDRRRDRRFARTALAGRLAISEFFLAGLAAVAGVVLVGWQPLGPLLLATPLFLLYLLYAGQGRGRDALAELAAPAAFGAVSSTVALAGGWPVAAAAGLWLAVAGRALPSVLYVRARLRLDKGRASSARLAVGAALLALIALATAAATGWLPWAAWPVFLALFLRTVWGLSPYRRPVSVRRLGFGELGWGVVTVVVVAAAWYWAGRPV